MTKTRRHRTARIARQATAASARATAWTCRHVAASLFTNHDWKQLTEALDGLLRVEFPSPFTDLEHLCPEEARLVVDLSYVRANNGNAISLRHGIVRAVDALTRLCIHAETLRRWEDLSTAFWMRVFSSDMCQSIVKGDEVWIYDATRCLRARGICVVLRWCGGSLSPTHVIDPLRRFLEATTGSPESKHIPIRVALQFEDCQLTMSDLKSIHELLKMLTPTEYDRLCDVNALHCLSLRGNPLYLNHLETLIALLEDPCTPRIDGLDLADTIPHDAVLPGAYPDIFQRALTTAFRTKAGEPSDLGLHLSLAECKNMDSPLIQAVTNSLAQATRPIRALTLARVSTPSFGAALRLARLLHTPFPTAANDFELDLTCLNADGSRTEIEEAMVVSLAEMTMESIRSIYTTGMTAGVGASCRLLTDEIYEDQLLTIRMNVPVSMFKYYDIAFVTHNGFFQLQLPDQDDQGRRVFGWVSSTAIAGIRIGEVDVVGSNCTRLILDDSGPANGDGWRFYNSFFSSMGANLNRLSVRENALISNELSQWQIMQSPRLVELNAENGGTQSVYNYHNANSANWSQAIPGAGAMLQVLNLTKCTVTEMSLQTLPAFPRLRSLHLANNSLKAVGLENLLDRLRQSRSLQYVDISEPIDCKGDKDYEAMKTRIQKHLQDEYITVTARAAFLSVVPHLESTHQLSQCLPRDAITTIFQMIGTRANRVVLW